jgi:hypothetical protein
MPKKATPKLSNVLDTGMFSRDEAVALQALAQGRADEIQQRKALDWIIYKACDFHGISFRETDRETSFAEGKRFVAQQIHRLLTFDLRKANHT